MPVVLDRLPLPNLTWYTGLSVLLLSCSVYYAGVQVTLNPNWKERLLEKTNVSREGDGDEGDDGDGGDGDGGGLVSLYHTGTDTSTMAEGRQMTPYLIPEVISFMFHEPLCIWTLINMAYCVLILLGTLIQRLVFGELRVSEQQHIKDKFWNFVFYKFIFVFGVMNVQAMDEVVLWCSWFSVLGFLHLLAQLCKDRFEYLSLSATTRRRTHVRLLGLLGIIFTIASFCLLICVVVGCHSGFNTFAFMVAECILLIVRTLYVITRYCIYLWDITHEGLWEKRGGYVYMTELVFELSELIMDMIHHIHMLVWGNMLLTMASLVICMQLRLLFYQLQHKIKSHHCYMRVKQLLNKYPEVSGEAVSVEERTCAICWEVLGIGRCLPCTHVFHASCLLAWLHQDLSCPTCRNKLHKPQSESVSLLEGLLPGGEDEGQTDGVGEVGSTPSPAAPQGHGWRYVSWLPSFSVEQSHTQLPRHQQASAQPTPTSQLDALARQVQQMFPDVSYVHILGDLQHTHSLEVTIDNILEHRLLTPPPMFTPQDTPSSLYDLSLNDDDVDDDDDDEDDEDEDEDEEEEEEEEEQYQDALPPTPSHITREKERERENFDLLSLHNVSDYSDTDSEGSGVVVGRGDGSSSGGRFSKCPREREKILSERRSTLLSNARQRYTRLTREGGVLATPPLPPQE